ncbi:MAG: guanylate kinase [Acidobacteria bacterium]|jgi:guanylate kinase|nr:guanylate kinase [Acidobacteriota bacterium]
MFSRGCLFIVSGPSGSGKTVMASAVLKSLPNLKFSVSYTTRAPRGREHDGVEYHFVSKERFESLIRGNALIEWAQVYGNYYGTEEKSIDDLLGQGLDVLLDIDIQGAATIRSKRPDAVSVFIMPPSYQVLRERLESRKLDKKYVIEQRLRISCEEITRYKDFDYLIINDELSRSTDELRAIIVSSRCRMERRSESARRVLETFGGLDAKNS